MFGLWLFDGPAVCLIFYLFLFFYFFACRRGQRLAHLVAGNRVHREQLPALEIHRDGVTPIERFAVSFSCIAVGGV
jgi:hypothetical protein